MLVRDLSLRDAIGDLVDNSVDAARMLLEKRDATVKEDAEVLLSEFDYEALKVTITANPQEFIIEDNCGGMTVETARNYAFRFGRSSKADKTPGSLGQFGIGMKRALFKLGNNFSIVSRTRTNAFTLNVDVNEWAEQTDWKFTMSDYDEDAPPVAAGEQGTRISITNLLPDVAGQFGNPKFITNLSVEIENENVYNIQKGLTIGVNGQRLSARPLEILTSPDFTSGYFEQSIPIMDKMGKDVEVSVRYIVGVGDPVLADGGWYIFCNDRLVTGTGPDQSPVSGWTGRQSDGGPIYHDQYERFRGYVFISSVDASLLPWNTTKNSMDMDSKLYQGIRAKMIEMMRPVISFLNNLKKEREADNPEENRPLHDRIAKTKVVALSTINKDSPQIAAQFEAPKEQMAKQKKSQQVIRYEESKTRIDRVKKVLNVNTLPEVGQRTFEYFYENEVQ
ncbi:ATP-binding protein [Hymenobacter antarcticus]